jgi:TolB-like protein
MVALTLAKGSTGSMSKPSKAVFLSYASQDAQAARRICDVLRAGGVEVWFDQSELRGGDVWDRQIKKQVHDCALFIAVISANTQARLEGYFRREWRLAVARSHDMADGRPFLVPIVIDATNERDAEVPESFRDVQWTRLPGGETPPAFCERIAALIAGSEAPGHLSAIPVPAYEAPPRAKRLRWVVVAAIGALVVLVGGWQAWLWMAPKSQPATKNSLATASTAPAAPEKSIAVLPFVDMSEKHDQEYFSDGLSEELIDHLAHNPGLKVIGRTSSFAFKGKNEDMRTIAATLGVANLLEGSVRKSGMELRITAQLIRASDGVHLWSQSFDRKMADIFKVQEEISDTVAKALNVALGAGTPAIANGTANVEAYNLMLQGDYFFFRSDRGDRAKAIDFYQQAIKLDSKNALAWAMIARAYVGQGNDGEIPTDEARSRAQDALRRAQAIDPALAEAHYALANIHLMFDLDIPAARLEYERALALDPHGRIAVYAKTNILGFEAANSGRFDDELHHLTQEAIRNPLDTGIVSSLASVHFEAGHLEQSAVASRKLLTLNPDYPGAQASYATVLLAMGKPAEALVAAEKESDEPNKLIVLACIYWAMDRRAESDAALRTLEAKYGGVRAYGVANVHACRDEMSPAMDWLERSHQQRNSEMAGIRIDPSFRKLHGDPRFEALLRKMNMPKT